MRWSIRRKLYVAFGVLIALVMLLGLVTVLLLGRMSDLEDDTLRAFRIHENVSDMETLFLQARRREKDFFMRQGQAQYAQLLAEHVVKFDEKAELLKKELALLRIEGDKPDELALKAERLLDEYRTGFEQANKTFHERGLPDTGSYGTLRRAAHTLEEATTRLADKDMMISLLQLRRAEKDYNERRSTKESEKVQKYLEEMRDHIESSSLRPETRSRLTSDVEIYARSFEEMMVADRKLEQLQGQFHEATEAIEPLMDGLAAFADKLHRARTIEAEQTRQNVVVIIITTFLLVIALGVGTARVVSGRLVDSVGHLIEGVHKVGDGDLTVGVKIHTNDEVGELGTAFNDMTATLLTLSKRIHETANSLTSVAGELTAAVSEQGAAMQQQAASVGETVSSVEEITRSANQVSETAENVAGGAQSSVETSERGEQALQESINGMLAIREQVENIAHTILGLSEKTQQIGTIIATVDDFAQQSSLLALNASIEAARAGEQGKAFSVVAAEIKSLAEQSQEATEQVRTILSDIQKATHSAVMVTEEGSKRVDVGVGLVESAGKIVTELAQTLKDSARWAKQIAAAAQQQSTGVQQISVAMTGIEQFSKQNVAAIRQTEISCQTLSSINEQLRGAIARYRLG